MKLLCYFLYFFANTSIFGVLLYILFVKKIPKFINDNVVMAVGVISIIISKCYIVFYNYEFNVDESFFIGNVIALLNTNDRFWVDIDNGTSGPTQTVLPYIFLKIGFPPNWQTLHFIFSLVAAFSWYIYSRCIFIYYHGLDRIVKYILVLVPLLYITLIINPIYNQYASEHVPVLCLIATVFLLLKKQYFIAGLVVCLGCLAKLMVVPIMFFICLVFIIENFKKNKKGIALLSVGVLSGITITLLILIYTDRLETASFFFIVRNLFYSSEQFWVMNMATYINDFSLQGSNESFVFNLMFVGFALIIGAINLKSVYKNQERLIVYYIFLVGFVLFSIFKSGRNSDHYFILSVFPMFCVLNIALRNTDLSISINQYLFIGFVVCLYTFRVFGVIGQHKLDGFFTMKGNSNYLREKDISERILKDIEKEKFDKKNTRLSFWGWGGAVHVMTNIPQATPSSCSDYEVGSSPKIISESKKITLKHIFLKRPQYFVIKTGQSFGLTVPIEKGFPELNKFVSENYTKLFDDKNGIIIYRMKRS